jgi:hypothetical protein
MKMDEVENKELEVLKTEAAGAVNLHETRTTDKPVQIDPPVNGGHPGPYDVRGGRFNEEE